MEKALEEGKVVSSNVGRAEELQDRWYIYTAHFPKSETRIPMLRMIIRNGRGWIAAVSDAEEKKGKVIAACTARKGEYGTYFSTYSRHRGHLALCHHLKNYCVRGHYQKYVNAVDEGKKALAEELSGMAMIRFATKMTDETLEDWHIDMSFLKKEDEAEEETDVEED